MFDSPVGSVEVEYAEKDFDDLSNMLLSYQHLKVSEDDFFLDVRDVARFRVRNGEKIIITPYPDADQASINLYLEGSVWGAVLHQRHILSFHGSSFSYKNKGIILCGRSGAGKSSVTEAFCQNGGRFISDDITPIAIQETGTTIIPLKTRIKLWSDSLEKLRIKSEGLNRIRPSIDKFYLPEHKLLQSTQSLDWVFILSTHNQNEFSINRLSGMEKYDALRIQIYRKVYLRGMPEVRELYFRQLLHLAAKVNVVQISRPSVCTIYQAMEAIESEIQ